MLLDFIYVITVPACRCCYVHVMYKCRRTTIHTMLAPRLRHFLPVYSVYF